MGAPNQYFNSFHFDWLLLAGITFSIQTSDPNPCCAAAAAAAAAAAGKLCSCCCWTGGDWKSSVCCDRDTLKRMHLRATSAELSPG
eukprot:1146559-Pelagomonas_calceolata.AAC.1